MKYFAIKTGLLSALLPLVAGVSLAGEDLYTSNGFEAPNFEPGVIHDQEIWIIPPGADGERVGAVIQGDHVREGSQALQLLNMGKGVYARLNLPLDQEFWLDFQFYMPPADEIANNPAFFFRGLTSSGTGGDLLVLQFSASGQIPGLKMRDGCKIRSGDWNRLTLRVNPEEGEWDLYIDGELALADEATQEQGALTRIHSIDFTWNGKAEYPEGGVFIDNVGLSTTKPEFLP